LSASQKLDLFEYEFVWVLGSLSIADEAPSKTLPFGLGEFWELLGSACAEVHGAFAMF
jgi:hypothetical protein